jgi:hypothetical protein
MHHAPKTVRWLDIGRYGVSHSHLVSTKEAAIAGHDTVRRMWPCGQSDSDVIDGYLYARATTIGRVQMLSPGVGWGMDGWRQCARQQLCVGCVER